MLLIIVFMRGVMEGLSVQSEGVVGRCASELGSGFLVESGFLGKKPLVSSVCHTGLEGGLSISKRETEVVGGSEIHSVKSFDYKNLKKHDGEFSQVTQGFGGLLDSVLFKYDDGDLSSTLEDVVVGVDEPEIISAESLNNDEEDILVIALSCETEKTQDIDQSKIRSDRKDLNKKKKEHRCTICGKVFPHKCRLLEHASVHAAEKLFKCEICNKTFTYARTLNIHMRTHTGKGLVKCKFCSKQCTSKSICIIHEKIHADEREYSCSICGKKFLYESNYKTHTIIHTGDMPYKCKFCNRGFSHSSNRNKHEKIHEREESFECDVCHELFTSEDEVRKHKTIHGLYQNLNVEHVVDIINMKKLL